MDLKTTWVEKQWLTLVVYREGKGIMSSHYFSRFAVDYCFAKPLRILPWWGRGSMHPFTQAVCGRGYVSVYLWPQD